MTNYTETQKQDVWKAAEEIEGENPEETRQDPYGNPIKFSNYGDTSKFGWEIDHIIPKEYVEINELTNLQAIQSGIDTNQRDSLDKMTRYGITVRQLLQIVFEKIYIHRDTSI